MFFFFNFKIWMVPQKLEMQSHQYCSTENCLLSRSIMLLCMVNEIHKHIHQRFLKTFFPFYYLSCSCSQMCNKMFKININRIVEYIKVYNVTMFEFLFTILMYNLYSVLHENYEKLFQSLSIT